MPRYRAILQVSDIAGESPRAVRSALNEQLRTSGLQNCQVVRVDLDGGPIGPRPTAPTGDREPEWRQQSNLGGVLLAAAVAWAMWFFWMMMSGPPD